MKKLTELKKIVSDPYTYIRKYKKKSGKKVVGYCCSYAPEELIWAAGALPLRMFGTNEGIHLADTHLQSYCCSLVRGILEEALSDKLDFLDGVVFPHTCDSFQRLSDIWRLNIAQPFHLDVVLPVKLDTPSAKKYLYDVLEKFRKDLGEALGVNITDKMLAKSIKTYNKIRALISKLYELRSKNPEILSGADFHAVIKAAMIMDRDYFLEALSEIVGQSEKSKAGQSRESGEKRLVLSGSVCTHPDIYDIIEEGRRRCCRG